ncbi:MAG: hypothetical protein ACFB9N_15425 [Geitlerinemataceae cyanobacterium]
MLLEAIERGADAIDLDLLRHGLEASEMSRRQRLVLESKEARLKQLLDERNVLSDEDIQLEDLEFIDVRSFRDLFPLLERLEEQDLAARKELGYATEIEPIDVTAPFGEYPTTDRA